MQMIQTVDGGIAAVLDLPPNAPQLWLTALGMASSTGWTHPRFSPQYTGQVPVDGYLDVQVVADAPINVVGNMETPIYAHGTFPIPTWCKGINLIALDGPFPVELASIAPTIIKAPTATTFIDGIGGLGNVIFRQNLGSYDDSFQPTGATKWDPWPHSQWKKLHHDLNLTITGPDQDRINSCWNEAVAAGLIAGIVAAFGTLGAALPAALSALSSTLSGCLANSYSVNIADNSNWEYWWT